MEQDKIGKFIAKLRKEQNLTQDELAKKIGVTDRAISKWENGRGMPDISLIKPLCDELKITINELLSGEKLNKTNYQDKFEENILNTIKHSEKKINKIKLIFKTTISFILLCFIIFITLFLVDINRIKNNKPVLFSTWGYTYTPAIDLHEKEIEIAINDYLSEKLDSESTHHKNEKGFASFRIYLLNEKKKNLHYEIYAWVLEEKYYLENNELKKDSGSSIPYKFIVEFIDDKYIVTDSRIPRDGNLYKADMANIFPRSVRNDMNKVYMDGTIEKLELNIQEQVKLYFHK
ncbi:MAG: helix-turn-helix transcriptional regulator [Firmicutes bacterium]|nr:helix-turn-helix transcriptional regulator [Bacillota bacterium]